MCKRKLKFAIVSLGVILLLMGVNGPWFSFFTYSEKSNTYLRFEMNPFTFTIKLVSLEGPTMEVTSTRHYWFYKVDTLFIGLCCIAGAILSLIGAGKDKYKLIIIGGGLILLSIPSFFLCLPGYYSGLSAGWGITITALGSILIISSLGLTFLMDKLSPYIHRKTALIQKQEDTSIRKRIKFRELLHILAVIGSIYSCYELSRIAYIVFIKGSLILNSGKYPLIFYQAEIFLCLYTAIYWIFYLLRKLLFSSCIIFC